MTNSDATMQLIGQGMDLGRQGRREEARELLGRLWAELGPHADPLHRCALAHATADVQDDLHAELLWDVRALQAADQVGEAHTDDGEMGAHAGDGSTRRTNADEQVAGFYPSLHLKLGEVYRKLGDLDKAHEHLRRGRAAADVLGDDDHTTTIRDGLDRLAAQLDAQP